MYYTMKKIILLFAIALFAFGCEDYNSQFDGYDDSTITNVQNIDYTFTNEDYESLDGDVAENYYFSESDPASNYLPAFFADKYPALDQNSAVRVTYNYKNESPSLSIYSGASQYTLTADDYASASATIGSAGYFSPSNAADDYLPSILASSVTDATSGDVYIVSYKYSDIDPSEKEYQEVTVFEQAFGSDLGEFTATSVTGDQTWYASSYQSDTYAKISGFSGSALDNEDWLISPEIDLSSYSGATVNYTQAAKFVNDQWEQLSVLISTDYNGTDPSAATWTTLTASNLPTGSDYNFVNSGDIDISSFDGQKIYVAFKYLSTTSNAATWEVKDVAVKATASVSKSAIIANAISLEELYTYTTSWKKTIGAYYLTSLDYDAMGENSGQPGQYNNFSSSIPPVNYLPKLAESKYPYAQEGDTIIMVYKYYDSGTFTKANKLFYSDGAWKMVIAQTDQYLLSSSGWIFDPTVIYSMVTGDYQLIVDYVKANIGASYVSSYGNNETYYGSNDYYGEFQIGTDYFDSSFASWEDAVTEAIGEGFLPSKFPNAITQVNGVDVYYVVTFAAYLNSMVDYTIKFQCTKSGPNPEFTLVSGPVPGTTIE